MTSPTNYAELNLAQLGAHASAHVTAGDKAHDKAEQHFTSAGLYLKEAKERVERAEEMTWAEYLFKHCRIGKSRSYELIAIADGRKTAEEIREKNADANRRYRARQQGQRQDRKPGPSRDGTASRPVDHHTLPLRRALMAELNRAVEGLPTEHLAALIRQAKAMALTTLGPAERALAA